MNAAHLNEDTQRLIVSSTSNIAQSSRISWAVC
ncbi:hypothetical protein VDGL01_04098 [Verticillium dahliae]